MFRVSPRWCQILVFIYSGCPVTPGYEGGGFSKTLLWLEREQHFRQNGPSVFTPHFDLIFGCLLGHFWAIFRSLGARLRRLGPTFGASWASHERSYGHLELILVTMLVSLVSFGRLFGWNDVSCLTEVVPNISFYI